MSQPNEPYQPYQQSPGPQAQPPVPAKKRHTARWVIFGAVIAVLLICGIGSALAGGGDSEKPAAQTQTTAPANSATATTAAQAPAEKPAATTAPTKAAPKPKTLTAAQEQAIGTAQDYLNYSHFSRQGLIKQLKYEGFTTADATYAVDYLKVDWNEQAVGAAKDYLAYSHFSRQGLIDQLKYEGFTTAQAKYGATGAGL